MGGWIALMEAVDRYVVEMCLLIVCVRIGCGLWGGRR